VWLLTVVEVLADPRIFTFPKNELTEVGLVPKVVWEGVSRSMAGHRRVSEEFFQDFGKLRMVGDSEQSSSTLRKKKVLKGVKVQLFLLY
jgi:hypothetical protein